MEIAEKNVTLAQESLESAYAERESVIGELAGSGLAGARSAMGELLKAEQAIVEANATLKQRLRELQQLRSLL